MNDWVQKAEDDELYKSESYNLTKYSHDMLYLCLMAGIVREKLWAVKRAAAEVENSQR